ncbi:hypothetical protein D1816_01770 [Aquimarina sp. AD10]|uniref:Cell division protein ZapB n=1 Tax=Aquimarina aggregata TaxID=1642818 RepID=A0A162FCC3_9FLAO|nr:MULTISPECIES: hypothetical protein [Aquimarina]AXT59128.1 hypothetical protein D1816_01770 [Aquimarina sp. AD10]KZS41146.1 hypothetical protein AWE51_23645 [Aquimarina aggregata]RKM93084.1 hypothetical protein D7033_20035 [Aquimarina sp. AD10]
MSDLIEIVDSLENRISKLLHKYELMKQQNADLKLKIQELESESSLQVDQLQQWEEKFSSLKNANAMLGSDKYKRETKLKINALIREIDMCIAQLSE